MGDVEQALIERPDRLQLSSFADLIRRAPAPWQVRGFLREQSVTLLYGQRASYKSFVALDVAASVASGHPWHDHQVVNPGLVIYVAGEGGGGMVQRARAWSDHRGVHPSKIRILFVTEPCIIQPDSEDMDILLHRIQEAIGWCPEGTIDDDTGCVYEHDVAREWPVLIVIDTLARCFSGDENQQEDMGQFIQGVDRLKMEFNCSILVLHHSGVNTERERGSTALGGACDTIYKLEADKDSSILTITNEKMKDSREPEPFDLSFRVVPVPGRPGIDDPDEELTSVVLESAEEDAEAKQARMLALLDAHGPLSWKSWWDLTKYPKPTFARYHVRLRQSGQIVKENDDWAVARSHAKKAVRPN